MTVAVSDIETALGRTLTELEAAQANMWIDDALLLIGLRLGDVDLLDQGALDYVVREATLERMKNPDGMDEESESIDDYTHAWKRGGTKRVTIWPEWWVMLSPRTRRAYSVQPS